MRRLVLPCLVVVLSWLGAEIGAAERPAYTPEQLSLIREMSECRISPDGKTVAFVSDITGALELWTVPATGGWPSQLTNLDERVESIRWSPDGKWIVFTSDYGGNERRDLFRVPSAGGRVEKLTDTKLSESEPRYSPDGKRLAFIADPAREFLFQLHVMDLETRKVKQLTKEPVNVLSPVWSRDGKTIAVTRSGDDQKGELLLVDADTGAKVVIEPAVKDGILIPQDFSPDGKSLLLLTRHDDGFMHLGQLELKRAKERAIPQAQAVSEFFGGGESDITEAHWSQDGIYFLRNQGGRTALCFLSSSRDKVVMTSQGNDVMSQISLDQGSQQMAVLCESTSRPSDAWVLPVSNRKGNDFLIPRQQVTFSLMGGIKPEELSRGHMVTYKSFDKLKIHALFVKPRVARLGTPPPAIVYVHGGPNSQKRLAFDPFIHVLAEAGFAVIAPNYRGSTGYGKKFEDANNKDWGGGDLKDLVAAVQFFGKRGDIDPKRVGITGGSYGGYMTLMALCKTPEIWKAGVERYGMPDLVMDYLLSKSRFGDWYETEMGNPKTHAALYRERSPLPYLDDIKAPLLIFQGANDTNVPKSESDLLVAVLKELKKPHEYVVYPDEGHGFTRRKNLLDCHQRTVEFFMKHVGKRK